MAAVTVAEYAARCGVSDRQVRNWRTGGRLVITSGGLIDAERSDRLRSATALRSRLPRVSADIPAPAVPPDESVLITLEDAKRRELLAKAALAELDLERQKGRIVEAAVVDAAAMKLGRLTRDALLGLPVRIAPKLAAETDILACEHLLTDALRAVLSDVAKLTRADLDKAA